MSELNLSKDMEEEVVGVLNNPYTTQRMGVLNSYSSNSNLESDKAKVGVQDAVKKLEEEAKDLFPDKEEVSKTTVVKDAKDNETKVVTLKSKSETKILGMKPLHAGIVVLGVAALGYLIYKKTRKAK